MELKNDSIREVILKEGIKSAKNKFKIEDVVNELKNDFQLVKGILEAQPSSLFEYTIIRLLPSEVTRFFKKDILEYEVNIMMQENPTADIKDVVKDTKKRLDKALIRKEYSEKSALYDDLYWGMDFANKKYGQEKILAIIKADPKLKQNLIEYNIIKGELVAEITEEPIEKTVEKTVEQPKKVPVIELKEEPEEEPEEQLEQEPIKDSPRQEEPQAQEIEKHEGEKSNAGKKQASNQEKKKIDTSKLSTEAKELIKKVKELKEKSVNEKDLVKKHLLRFQLRMLISKLQQELDLYYLKEEYKIKRQDLKVKKEQEQSGDLEAIKAITEKIKQRENLLNAYKEYDYYSQDFMFPRSTIKLHGGINEFAKLLKEDDNIFIQDAGKRVAAMTECRRQIEVLRKQMEDRQKSVEAREKEVPKGTEELDSKEKENRMTIKNKNNSIFTKISVFFENAKKSIQDFGIDLSGRTENFRKELAGKKVLFDEYKKKDEELRQQFKLQRQQLREEAKKAINPLTQRRDSEFIQRLKQNVTGEETKTNINLENTKRTETKSNSIEPSIH